MDPRLNCKHQVGNDIVALRATGMSFYAIAATLNKQGRTAARGGRWYAATIHHVLRELTDGAAQRCDARCQQHASLAGITTRGASPQRLSPERTLFETWNGWTRVRLNVGRPLSR